MYLLVRVDTEATALPVGGGAMGEIVFRLMTLKLLTITEVML